MEHHPTLAPSSFPALQVCSHFVSRGGESNEYAQRGDRIHALTEWYLTNVGVHVGEHIYKDEADVARWMADKTRELLASVEDVGMGVSIRDPLTGEEITFGTVDCWGYDANGLATVIDWKTGQIGDYTAQIMIYALGLMDKLNDDDCACVLVFGDQRKIERIIVVRDEAEALLRDTLARKFSPDEPYVKSTYCNRCYRRPICPAWVEPATEALSIGESSLDISEGLDIIVKDPDKLGKFIKGWKAISKLVEDHDVTGAAIEFLEKGIPVGDYEVRERKGRREYTKDSVQTILKLIVDGDLNEEQASSMFKLDVKEVDKFFKETHKPCPIDTIVKGTYKILVDKTNGK